MRQNSLDILSYVRHSSILRSDFPTWCPQWSSLSGGKPLSSGDYDFNACFSKEVMVQDIGNEAQESLIIRGLNIDRVEWTGTLREQSLDNGDFDSAICTCWQAAVEILSEPSNGKPLIEAFAHTLTVGMTVLPGYPTSVPAGDEHLFTFAKYMINGIWLILIDDRGNDLEKCPRMVFELAELARAQSIGHTSIENWQPQAETQTWMENRMTDLDPANALAVEKGISLLKCAGLPGAKCGQFQSAFNIGGSGRTFFLTRSGRMGVGPRYMEPEDIVVVLFGGKTPYILRPADSGCYHFVGECYIDGLMHGEAIELTDDSDLNAEWFTLR